MTTPARVRSVESLREGRTALARFVDEARGALNDIDGDAIKTLNWLQYDRITYWQRQVKVRTEAASQARIAFQRKKLISMKEEEQAIEEWQALQKANRSLQVAEDKLEKTKHWIRLFEREHTLYRGQIHAMSDTLQRDIPHAMSRLDRMVASLEAYARTPTQAESVAGGQVFMAAAAPIDSVAHALADAVAWRRRAPSAAIRSALIVNDIAFGGAGVLSLESPSKDWLDAIGLATSTPAPTDKVVFGEGWSHGVDLLLVREHSPEPGDSGWFVGPATQGTLREFSAVSFAALAAASPALARLLELPMGSLALTYAGRLDHVLDGHDQPLLRGGLGIAEEDAT